MPKTNRPQYRRFIQRLRAARLAAGLSQAEAARRLGWAQSIVSKCERGERRVDVVELAQFAGVYRKGFEYFIAPSGQGRHGQE
jgi:transcriptional regulator with XRE-family HTH domain